MTIYYKRTAILVLAAALFSTSLHGCKGTNILTLSGSIESEQIDVNSEVSGMVTSLDKEEGSFVNEGDVIVTIDASLQELAVKQSEALVKAKKARFEEMKAGTRREQLKQAEASAENSGIAVKTAETSVDNAQINYNYWLDKYNKIGSLNESGATSDSELQDARYKLDTANQQLITAQKQLSSAKSQLKSSQAQLELLQKGATNQALLASEAELEQSQAALEQAKLLLSKYKVKAPVKGTFLLRNVKVGDIVNPGTAIGTISDLTDLWIRVYIPQKNLGSIKLGQELNLKAASLPGKTTKGKIVFISGEAEFTPKNTETSEAKENTVFKVKVKIQDNIESLKPGMTVDVHIPLGE